MNPAEYAAVLDTSGWQYAYYKNGLLKPGAKPYDFSRAKALGIEAVIHRIGNGRSFDHSYPMARESCRAAALPFTAYYYFQPNSITARDSVELVGEWLTAHPGLDLPIMLDCEHYNGTEWNTGRLGAYIREWLERAEVLTKRAPIIYSAAWWWNSRVAGDFSSYQTIHARYSRGNTTPPSDISKWGAWIPWDKGPKHAPGLGDWEGWQFTSSLNSRDFGAPTDAATFRLDGNVVKRAAFNDWVRKHGIGLPLPSPWPTFDPHKAQWGLWPLNPNKPPLNRGAFGDAVSYLQGVLHHRADRSIVIDGDFGPQTEDAVRRFQAYFGLTVDGIVGRKQTWPMIDLVAVS